MVYHRHSRVSCVYAYQKSVQRWQTTYDVPITELNPEGAAENDGRAGGAGLGEALHGSSPSSYTELIRGFSAMKLAPNCEEEPP